MIVLSFSQVSKNYYEQNILNATSFSINSGEKLGLIGKNGAGKTTLLRLISKEEKPDSGMIHIDKTCHIGYMQQSDLIEDISLIDYCTQAFTVLINMEKQLHSMEKKMATFTDHNESFNQFMSKYDDLVQTFERMGGYLFKSKAKGILTGLGFNEKEQERSITSLSGGQLARLKLARLLIDEPDILLLDEPTNHLDIKTTMWLEVYLKQYPKTLIIVSHDRFFLDALCTSIMEIENCKVNLFKGNYSAFKLKKKAMLKQMEKEYEKYQSERKKQEEIIRRFKQHGTEKLAKRARSREKRLEKLKAPEAYHQSSKQMALTLKTAISSGNEVLHVEAINKAYHNLNVLNDVSFNLFKGEKIGLIGNNGSGKSTLLKIINHDLEPDTGSIHYGHQVLVAYYDQGQKNLSEEQTIFEEIHNMIPQMDEVDVRTLLGKFLFSNEDVFKPIHVLSGGEKARVMLTKLFLTDSNLLLLDEPTNHLDIYSKEVLESSLQAYDGTIIVISHDRYFLNKICDQIIEIENGKAVRYLGNYDYFVEKKAALEKEDDEDLQRTKTALKQDKKKERQRMNERKALQSKFNDVESAIDQTEQALETLAKALCKKEVYSDAIKSKQILAEERLQKETLEKLYAEWENLAKALEV